MGEVFKVACVQTTTGPEVALMAVFPDWKGSGEGLAKALANANPREKLPHRFHFPKGKVYEYDLTAPRDKWVITKINEYPANRQFDLWPRLELHFP